MGMWHLSNLKNKSTNHQCVCLCGMTKKWPWSCFKLDPPAARESHRKAGSAAWPWTLDLGSQWQLQFTEVNMIWITTFWVVRFPTCYWKINIILSLQFTRWRCGTSRNGSLGFRLPQDPFLTLSNTGLYCKAGLLDCPGTFGGSCNISTHQVKKYGDWVWKTQVQCVIRPQSNI